VGCSVVWGNWRGQVKYYIDSMRGMQEWYNNYDSLSQNCSGVSGNGRGEVTGATGYATDDESFCEILDCILRKS